MKQEDNTFGCTRQACAFAGAYEEFKKIKAIPQKREAGRAKIW